MGTEGPTAVIEPLWRGLPPLGTETLSGSATCALPPRHEAVRSARDFTRRTLQRWEISRDLDEIALVVSELVTNALRHGLDLRHDAPATTATQAAPAGQTVRLQLMRWSAQLVCAVRDPSEAAPRRPDASAGCPKPVAGEDAGLSEALRDLAEFAGLDALEACPGLAAESGRGLYLVDSFSDCWGWHRLTGTRPGKVVWAMFRFPSRTPRG